MVDKTIGDLEQLADVYDDTLFPVEHGGSAYHITEAQSKAYVIAEAKNSIGNSDAGETNAI